MSVSSLFSENSYSLRAKNVQVDGDFIAGSVEVSDVTVSGDAQIAGEAVIAGEVRAGANLRVTGNTFLQEGVILNGGTPQVDSEYRVLTKRVSDNVVVIKTITATTSSPAWVWLNGSNPQPSLVTIKAVRIGDYCICELLATGVELNAVGRPYTATFTLPYPVNAPFSGAAGELIATSSFDPTDSSAVSRCVFSSRAGSTTLGQVYIDCTGTYTVSLSATIIYSGLAP